MSISSFAVRRRSFKLHKAILGSALALAAFAPTAARAATVTVNTAIFELRGNNIYNSGANGAADVTVDPANGESLIFNNAAAEVTAQGSFSITSPVTMTSVGVIDTGGANTVTITGAVALTNTLTLDNGGAGAGIVVLSGTNTGNAAITLANSGAGSTTVQVTSDDAFGAVAGGVNIVADTTLDLQGVDIGNEAIAMNQGTLEASTGDSTYSGTLTAAGGGYTLSADADASLTLDRAGAAGIAGNFAMTKAGDGTVVISTENTSTNTITISAGTLAVTHEDGLGTAAGATTIQTGGTLDLRNVTLAVDEPITLNAGGTLQTSTGTSNTAAGAMTFANAGSRTIDVSGTQLTIGGVIGDGGNGLGFDKTGTGTLVLGAANTYTGLTNINAGTLRLGVAGALANGNTVTINNAATFDLGGFASNSLTINTTAGSTLKNGVLSGALNAQGLTVENITGNADVNFNSGSSTLTGTNAFGDVAFNAGTVTIGVPTTSNVPLTSSGTISANGGQINVDATGLTATQIKGDKTIIAGTVPDAVASATTFTYAGSSEKFAGFNKPLVTPALYDVSLLKGSLVLSVKNKAANDICGVTGLCADGSANGKLEGLDKSEVRSLYGKVVLPAIESGKLDLPFWTTKPQMSKYLISGLMPRNVDAAGTVLSSYNDRMADTLFERLPLRQFDPVEVVEEEIVIEEVETKEPVRGLWKTTAEGEVIEVNGTTYEEDPSLTAQYADRDNMRAWVRGFGGDVAAAQTTRYVYKSYNATNAGGVVGVDYAAFDDFQIGVYANYGDLAINTDSNKLAGSGSWNPTGWGGGITADYWTDSYYVQGLFGASAFSGDQDRSIVAIGGDLGGGNTLSGNKNVTSYIGALRAGAPMQVGSFYLEPQAQATWSGNQEDSFSEGGNTNFKLKYKSRETNFLQTELGIKVAYPIALGQTQQLVPSIRVAWLGDWNMDNEGQKIGYRFSNKTIDLESDQQDQNGALLEGGLDYTVANIGATSFKVYGRGGAEVWDTERGTNWRASGGITVQF